MKKWLVGCLVTGLILLIIGGGLAYWFVWRPLSAAGGEFMGQVEDLKKIGEADQAVKNQSAYTAPADGKLSIAQVNAFVAIQKTISDKMGPDFAVLEEKYKTMNEQKNTDSNPDLKDVMGAYNDITKLIAKAKEAQVAALNVQNMSLAEYRWIREQASAALPYIAMDVPVPAPDASTASDEADATATAPAEASVDEKAQVPDSVNDAIEQAKQAAADAVKESIPGGQQMQDSMNGPESEAARANAELLRPHKDLLYKTMTAAWLSM